MDEITLSVIVPAYNVEEYIEICINSVLNQTYKNIELIIVDDGSTDDSGVILDRLSRKENRITVIHKANEGLIKARLEGVLRAKGKYVTFVDGDDWIDKEMYNDLISVLQETNVDIVISGIYRYISPENIVEDVPRLQEGFYDKEEIRDYIWPIMLWSSGCDSWEVDPSLCTKIFKREEILKQLESVSELNVYFAEDTVTIYPILLRVDSIYVSKRCYYYHRQKAIGEVSSYIKSSDFFDKTYKVYKYLEQVFCDHQVMGLFEKQLNNFYANAIQLKKRCYLDVVEKKEEVFPFFKLKKDAKIIVYGAGVVGKKYMEQNATYHFVDVVMWVDKDYNKIPKELNVYSPREIRNVEFDNLLIAVQSASLADEIREELVLQGVDKEKIIWVGASTQVFRG